MTLYLDTPTWGVTGEGNEEITRHLPCCTSPFLPTYAPTKLDDDTASPDIPTLSNTSPLENGDTNIYEIAAKEYKPMWFNRSTGWNGRTWIEAKTFCGSKKNTSNEQMVLCPYDAICPLGSTGMPSQGVKPDLFQMWVPTLGFQENEWVQIGSDQDTVCMTHRQVVDHPPEWGLNGEGNEEITRNVMCCTIHGGFSQQDDTVQIDQPGSVADVTGAHAEMEFNHKPVKYDRSSGWAGKSYAAAIIFCASRQSRIPCFYESICPNGENADPHGGVDDNPNGAWAPMMDAPNSWVQIGKVGTCQKYTDMHSRPPPWGFDRGIDSEKFTRSILCCEDSNEPGPSIAKPYSALTERENGAVNNLRPLWFDSSHGYRGTTHEEADLFCKAAIGMHLCPIEAYCPNGPTTDNKPLFLQREAFHGEQWAPFISLTGTQSDLGNKYVMIGTLDGDPSSTCMPYDSLHTNPLPPWYADGSKTEVKQHVMCCDKKESIEAHSVVAKGAIPVWLDRKHGWGGGSYDDAQEFCNELGGKKLCPYAIYCPDGLGSQPLGGHSAYLNYEGIQYAPIFGASNEWVMIGQKDGNAATTCMLHSQLEGGKPDWGLNEERQDIKNHILCCTF